MEQIHIDDVLKRIDVIDDGNHIHFVVDNASINSSQIIAWLQIINGHLLDGGYEISVGIAGKKPAIPLTGPEIVDGELDEILQERRSSE